MSLRRLLFAALLFLAGFGFLELSSVEAQTFRGAINGTVADPSGAIVPGAQVTATDTATGIEHSTVSTGDGQFSFQDLPLGNYKVTVTASGFPPFAVNNVAVTAGSIYTLPVKLVLTQQTTTVEVSAAALALDTTTETQTTIVAGSDLQATPLNGRDFTQLVALTPGFSGYSGGGYGSLNGSRANQINWQIDGSDNNDLWHNIPAVNQGGVSGIAGVVLPIDATEEFSVQTQSSAETGRSPGGTANLTIKSGGNTIHGTAYYFNRNEFFAATPPLLSSKQKVRNDQYGASVQGPILKDRTFYFANFEKQKFVIGVPSKATVPSLAYQALAQDVLANPGNKYGTYAPVAVNPVSKNLLANLWPSSILNGPAGPNNYVSTDPEYGYSYNGVAKLDHKINDKNNLSFHWTVGQGNQVAPVGTNFKWYYQGAPIHVQNYALVWNSTFSPRLTNQVIAGVNYFNQVFYDFNNGIDPKASGLYLSPSTTVLGAPNLRISGFDQTGRTPPSGRNDITGLLQDTVSYLTGKHQFRFGGEFRKAQLNEFYHRLALGRFQFNANGNVSANDPNAPKWDNNKNIDSNVRNLADFLAGYVYKSSIAIGDPERLVYVNTFDLFAQDAWQVSRRLTVNYGLRYDYIGPFHDSKKDLSVFVPSQGGLVFQGAGLNSIYPQAKNNLSPRIGFAFQPKSNGDLVVRGSFGVYFDSPNLNPFLDNRPGNNGPNGVESNPAGSNPVSTIPKNGYSLPTNNSYIFPATGPVCPTGNVATSPGCGKTIYNVFSISQNFRSAYFYNYNLNVEKSLGKSFLLQVGYVGSEGRKLLTLTDINQPAPADASNPATLPSQQRRPFFSRFPNFGVINEVGSSGTSNYNSLQTTLKIRSWHRLNSQLAYTWSHSLDEVTYYRGRLPQDSFNLKGDYGNSDFDTRHSLSALFNYELPGTSRARWLSNGWQLSSLLSFHTGQPFNITANKDQAGTGEGFQRPDLIGDPFAGVSHKIAPGGYVQWINATAFADAAPGKFGNLARNKFYGPGFGSVDFSVFKNTKITERVSTQLRFEFFNLFNRANWAPPSTNPFTGADGWVAGLGLNPSNGFGQITDTIGSYNGAPGIGAGEPFNLQLALKLIF